MRSLALRPKACAPPSSLLRLISPSHVQERWVGKRIETNFSHGTLWNRHAAKPGANLYHGTGSATDLPQLWGLQILALPPGGRGKRTFLCFDCGGPDPLTTEKTTGWLKSELQPPKDPRRSGFD
jgi:hypothetical protein